jgi:hypothetical protein
VKPIRYSFVVALLALAAVGAGCGGDGSAPPVPFSGSVENGSGTQPPAGTPSIGSFDFGACSADPDATGMGGIWVGDAPHLGGQARLLIAETGEFHLVTGNGWLQFFGAFQVDVAGLSAPGAVGAWIDGLMYRPAVFQVYDMRGELDGSGRLVMHYRHESDSPSPDAGTITLVRCDSVYARESSLAKLAGAYTDSRALNSLHIDEQGAIFYQDTESCVGNGTASLIDGEFNMYRISLELANCNGFPYGSFGPTTFNGLGYLSDSGSGASEDVVEFALGATYDTGYLVWSVVAKK